MAKKITVQTSWDDGCKLDLHMADLLLKYKIPATFYIPIMSELDDSEVRQLAEDFEIGGHTIAHPVLTAIEYEDMEYEIWQGKKYLETIIKRKIKSFCYPKGKYNDAVIQEVRKAGFTNARTTDVFRTSVDDPFRKGTTIHVYNRAEYNGKDWLEVALEQLKKVAREGGIYHVWGHSWEVEKFGNWQKLETLFKEMQKVMK